VLSGFVMRCVVCGGGLVCVYVTHTKTVPPKLKAQLKLHKTGNPIRPVISNKTAPAYKLTK